MRAAAARYAVSELERHGPILMWVIDDTGFLKQGKRLYQRLVAAGKPKKLALVAVIRKRAERAPPERPVVGADFA